MLDWIHFEYPPVDIFKTSDMKLADSIINGSLIQSMNSELNEYINAKLLWNRKEGFNSSFDDWEQETDEEVDFKLSCTGIYNKLDSQDVINQYIDFLEENKFPTFTVGHTWYEIGVNISSIISNTFNKPKEYSRKATKFSYDNIVIKNEYDFQNVISFLLRPLFPTTEFYPEEKICKIDGNYKIGDFGILGNKIVIEAKYIFDISSKATVIKTIKGLSDFYSYNPNVKVLVFLVLFDEKTDIDKLKLEGYFNNKSSDLPIIVKFIENIYK